MLSQYSRFDPERLSLAKFFCGARFLFDHRVHDGEHAGGMSRPSALRSWRPMRVCGRHGLCFAQATWLSSGEVTKLPIMTDNIVQRRRHFPQSGLRLAHRLNPSGGQVH